MASRTASSLVAIASVAWLSWTSLARAADPTAADRNLAQSLFDEGRRLMDAGRYEEACPRFADSERLDPGGGTVLNLALCYEKQGALALASSTYAEALSFAIAEHRHEREEFARERVAALAPRLPHLTLRIGETPEGLVVQMDGNPVPAAAWGISTPVDPGRHVVDARAPGFAPFQAVLTFAEGQQRELAVTLGPEAPREEGPVAPPPPRVVQWRTPAFYVTAGLAVASLGASVVTGVMALQAHNTVQQECSTDRGYCSSPNGPSEASRATTLAWVSTVTLGGAVVAGVIALILPLAQHQLAALRVGPGGALVTLAY